MIIFLYRITSKLIYRNCNRR